MADNDLPVRHAKSRYKTIVCSFCMAQVDDACFSWATGICICRDCLGYATEEVAKSKKMNELGTDLKEIATKLTVREKTPPTQISQAETVRDIQRILSESIPEPDDIA